MAGQYSSSMNNTLKGGRIRPSYDVAAFVAHSLYELTFFGFDAGDVEVNINREIELLNELPKWFIPHIYLPIPNYRKKYC